MNAYEKKLEAMCLREVASYVREHETVKSFQRTILSHTLGHAEARDSLFQRVLDDTEDETFSWAVVDLTDKLSGAEGFRYDW